MNENLILEFDELIRSIEISKNDAFSFLLGAGASISSGIQSASECIWEWKRDIYLSKNLFAKEYVSNYKVEQVKDLIQKWLDNEGSYLPNNHSDEYSFYAEKCYPIEDDRRKYFQRICEKKEPSVGYKLLSLLFEAKILQSVWTTNFDDLCNKAVIKSNNTVIDISLGSVDRIFRPSNHSELLLIKLHGDYKYGKLKNTNEELIQQDETFRSKLESYLNDKHIIISGYSGRDNSVMDVLKESYSKRGSGRLYWCGYGRDIPAKVADLIKIARENGRTAFYIPTDGFDKLMINLSKACVRDNENLSKKMQEYLKSEKEDLIITPFSLDVSHISSIIKSNAFPIQFPGEVFQFEMQFDEGEKPWQTIRELTKDYEIAAVPFKRMIWALGKLSDLNKCFNGRMKSQISRKPLGDINLQKNGAIHHLFLTAITKALTKLYTLKSNNKDLLWHNATTSQRLFNGTIYFTHQALRFSLNFDGNYYLTLNPDFHISTEGEIETVSKEIKQEIGRTYFEKLRNSNYNSYVNEWRSLLFKSSTSKFELEFPNQSASGFVFSINKNPVFAKIMKAQTAKGITLNEKFPNYLLKYKGIQYPEPELLFSPKHPGMQKPVKDFHPMRGLTNNKPFDSEMTGTLFENTIKLAVICPNNDSIIFSKFLKQHVSRISSGGINKAYLIEYPGFYEAYNVSLNVPEIDATNWEAISEPTENKEIKLIALNLKDKIIQRIDSLTQDEKSKVVIIYIPERWTSFLSFSEENEDFDLHDYIKAYCAEKGVSTQFIQEHTIKSELSCQINWWLSLSYYVKSLRTPWILDTFNKTTAFAGIGYSIRKRSDSGNIIMGCSHIYNSQGQGLKYKLSKVDEKLYWDGQDKPHLSYNDAFKFGLSIKELFFVSMNELPKRVVVHKRTYFTQDEISGIRDSLLGNGIEKLDLIEINFEDDVKYMS